MTINILGPVAGGHVTIRPARANPLGVTNTWFRGCSSPGVPDGTVPDPDAMNDLLANLRTLFSGAGIELDGADDMLLRATRHFGIRHGVDTGTANNIEATFLPPVRSFFNGLMVSVEIAASNTGATQFTFADLASGNVLPVRRRDGSALEADDLVTGQVALFVCIDGVLQLLANGAMGAGGGGGGSPTAGLCGQLVLTMGGAALGGTLKANGAEISRATYADLWTFAQASGRIVSETDWQNAALRRWTSFSTGDGSTTFRLPNLLGEFMRFYDDGRGVDSGRVLGTQQAEMIGPHSHGLTGAPTTDGIKVLGSIVAAGSDSSPFLAITTTPASIGIGTLAVANNSGTENRVRNIAILPCIVY